MIRAVRSWSRGELLLAAVLAVWSVVPLATGLLHVAGSHDVLGGPDGPGVLDHYQYLAWIREAGEHGLISNRFTFDAEPAVYLQPMWLLSGLGWRAGAGVQVAFLLWKPVAVLALAAGAAAYVRRTIDGAWPRLAALALALFYFPPVAPGMRWTGLGSDAGRVATSLFGYELTPATYVWGYFQTAIAVGLMPVFLLAAGRLFETPSGSARRPLLVAAAAGLTVSWVHPWQGVVLAAIVLALAVWQRQAPARMLAAPLLATLAPLVYFAVLSRTDTAWRDGGGPASTPHLWGWLALAVAPLAIFALLGALSMRGRALDVHDRMLLIWPVVTIAAYAALDRTFFYNVLSGLTLPLAVLAVRSGPALRALAGGRRAALALAAAAAVGVATVPGLVFAVDDLRDARGGGLAYYLKHDEARALELVDDAPASGGVLSRLRLGEAVPALAGRRTFVGHPSWTPAFGDRVDDTEALFDGRMAPARARAFARSTGARFVFVDCETGMEPRAALAPLAVRSVRAGCAELLELRP
jgi:hypothetical protein